MSTEVSRILVSRMRFIGDVVLTTPVIRSLRNAYPDAYIAYLAEKEAVSLLAHDPNLNETIPYDFSRSAILEQIRVARLLRKKRFDLVLDLFSNPRSALLTYLSGAHRRVGLNRKGRGNLYTTTVTDDGKPKTAIEFHHQFLSAVGVRPMEWRTYIVLTDDERIWAARYIRDLLGKGRDPTTHSRVVGIHVGASWPAKHWFPDRFARLADHIALTTGAAVILTGGPRDRGTIREVLAATQSAPAVAGVLPIRRLAGLLEQCSVVVSNDAGPMHIAVAVGTPTIGLFGPGEEDRWFPYDRARGHRAIREDVPCHPCHLDVCNRTGSGYMECMRLLEVETVFEAVTEALGFGGPRLMR